MDPRIAWPRFHPRLVINCRERIKTHRRYFRSRGAQRGASGGDISPARLPHQTGDNKQREIIFPPLTGAVSRFALSCCPDRRWGRLRRYHFSLCVEKLITLSNYRKSRIIVSQTGSR